jgi:RNA polymerase sigma-70 factor (ECF subfamily)
MELKKQNFIRTVNNNRGIIRSLCKIYYRRTEDQEDAFHDVVLQLWKSLDTFRGDCHISTWIYRVSLNTIFSKIRSDKRSVAAEPIDTSHYSISTVKADDNVELLSMILQSLKHIDKAIMVLYLEGYGNKDIAEILKMSRTNVATRLNRVTSQLKMKFNNKDHAIKQL